jgi:hypothetical protein
MHEKAPAAVFLLTILVTVLAAGSCGGDGDRGIASPETTAAATDAPSGTPLSTPVSGGASAILVDLFTSGLNATYTVTYETTLAEGSEGDRFVVFNRPPLTRIDTIPADSSEPFSLIIGGGGAATVSCSGGPDQWQCFETEPLGDSLLFTAGPFVFLDTDDLASFDVSETEGRTLAGQPARCFRLRPRQGETDEELEYCLNSDGVPLFSAPLFGSVEATEVSLDVSEQDFAPPAELQQ